MAPELKGDLPVNSAYDPSDEKVTWCDFVVAGAALCGIAAFLKSFHAVHADWIEDLLGQGRPDQRVPNTGRRRMT
jgi:hypothetical protein